MSVKAIYSSEARVDNQENAAVNKSDLAARMKLLSRASGFNMYDAPKGSVQIRAATVAKRPSVDPMEAIRQAQKSKPLKVVEQEREAVVVKQKVNATELLANIYALKVDDPEFDAKAKQYAEQYSQSIGNTTNAQARNFEFLLENLAAQTYMPSRLEHKLIMELSDSKINELDELVKSAKANLLELIQSRDLNAYSTGNTFDMVLTMVADRLDLYTWKTPLTNEVKPERIQQILDAVLKK